MSDKKIGIDLMPTQPVSIHKYHGGGEYAKRIFFEIVKKSRGQKIVCIYDPSRPIIPEIEELCREKNIELIEVANYLDLGEVLNVNKVDCFYSALPRIGQITEAYKSNIEYIYTIHGLRVLEMPTDKYEFLFANTIKDYCRFLVKQVFKAKYVLYYKKKYKKVLVNTYNKKIVVPSFHTKYSIIEKFPEMKMEKISVLYSPRVEVNPDMKIELEEKFNTESKKFILLILGSRWIKNNYRAVKALDEIYSQNPELAIKTLIIGVNFNKNPFKKVKNIDKFIFKSYVESEVLERLYKEAFLFIYPTLNEGFGYPPLEAMKYGTPVIASAISSVTEVCDNAVLYFNPYAIDEIKNRVLQVIQEDEIRKSLIEKGNNRFKEIKMNQDKMLNDLVEQILQ